MNNIHYEYGYIYIRTNNSHETNNIVKLGITESIIDRNSSYITNEYIPGRYVQLYRVPINELKNIDKILKYNFISYNKYYKGGGTEFYEKSICDLIEPFLIFKGINYKRLNDNEINNINRKNRLRIIKNSIEKHKNIKELQLVKNIFNEFIENKKVSIKPDIYQEEILNNIIDHYKENNKGKIILPCGFGKTLLSIFAIKKMNMRTVLFGVPNIYLQTQIKKEILKVFPNENNIIFVGGNGIIDKEYIKGFLDKKNDESNETKFVITTYHSSYLLASNDIKFDIKIGDEAHHLARITGLQENNQSFMMFHKISATKELYMTATEKIYENKENDEIFGKYIIKKPMKWAIENNKIVDYYIIIIKNKQDDIDNIINKMNITIEDMNLFISVYLTLKSLEKYKNLTHILLYTNTTKNAELASQYINLILNLLDNFSINKEDIYNKALYSELKGLNIHDELEKFSKYKYGIISCVYIFGEGFDMPKLNGVCVAENMQSEIRIVQYLSRPLRKESGNNEKLGYILVPYIDNDNWENDKNGFYKVRKIISEMRNEDDTITQKIKLIEPKKIEKKNNTNSKNYDILDEATYNCYNLEENDVELDNLQIRLRYSKALYSNSEEQDEYNYIKMLNKIHEIKSKKEYVESKEKHIMYIENPEIYFKNKGVWKCWLDFLAIDTKIYIQGKEEWIRFCKEKRIKSIEDYHNACKIYSELPTDPGEFYKDFSNIQLELNLEKIRRR